MINKRRRPENFEGTTRMKRNCFAASMAAVVLLLASNTFAQAQNASGQGRAIITVLTKHNEVAPNVRQQDVSAKVNGKEAEITGWAPFKAPNDKLELVVMIDAGARNLGRQFEEIKSFIQNLSPDTKVAIGYMQNGHTAMAGPLSTDHNRAVSELHLPVGPTTNPYFSLSDLAQSWPSNDPDARREVVMLSDGVDPENRRFDPDDPYVQSAIKDAVRAGIVVYTLYWRSIPSGENGLVADGGQSLLNELVQATGGNNYWMGNDNPVSFQPFFADLMRRFDNQYALTFSARLDRKPSNETLKLKIEGLGLQVTAPQQVFVHPQGAQ
jgi:hypothetical protein